MKIHFISHSRVDIFHLWMQRKMVLAFFSKMTERMANMDMLCFEKLEEKSYILYCGIYSFWLKGSKPEKSIWNLIWSPNIWKLWDRATRLDYTEMCRHRIWHLLNMLRCLVTVSEALKNFPLWESHLAGHPQLLDEKFLINVKVKDLPEPD